MFKRDRYRFLNMYQGYTGYVFEFRSYFQNHPDPEIAQLYINLTTSSDQLSENWANMHQIKTLTERDNLKKAVSDALHHLKLKSVLKMLRDNSREILKVHSDGGDVMPYMEKQQKLEVVKMELCGALGIVLTMSMDVRFRQMK